MEAKSYNRTIKDHKQTEKSEKKNFNYYIYTGKNSNNN